jgi:hypothetical protein
LLDAVQNHAKVAMRAFCESELRRPFNVLWDPVTKTVDVDRAVVRSAYAPTMQKLV